MTKCKYKPQHSFPVEAQKIDSKPKRYTWNLLVQEVKNCDLAMMLTFRITMLFENNIAYELYGSTNLPMNNQCLISVQTQYIDLHTNTFLVTQIKDHTIKANSIQS